MNTQGGNIWVFNIIKNTGKIKLKELLQDLFFFFLKEEEHSELSEAMWWADLVASLLVIHLGKTSS